MKIVRTTVVASEPAGASDGTRARIRELLLRHGSLTVAELAAELELSTPGVRRHLEAMRAAGQVDERECDRRAEGAKRGRPARSYTLTDAAREQFPHSYDDLAVAALRHLAEVGGRDAVRSFADAQVSSLEDRCRSAMDGAGSDPLARAEALADALSQEGYAASAQALASGGQLCQRHCPVAHVAAEFPELCQAETEVIGRLVGSHVQRLATIARGDGVCTTHVPSRGATLRVTG